MWTQIEKIHETGENTSADHSGSLDTGTTLFLKSIDYFSIFFITQFSLIMKHRRKLKINRNLEK